MFVAYCTENLANTTNLVTLVTVVFDTIGTFIASFYFLLEEKIARVILLL